MTLAIDKLRNDTPHSNDHIHLDNAGAALMCQKVVDRQIAHLQLEAKMGGYEAQTHVAEELDKVYEKFARLIGAKTPEIALTSSATDSWDRCFYSFDFKAGDRVITGFNEYCSNYVALLHMQKRRGIEIIVIPPTNKGDLDLNIFEAEAKKGATLISIAHVPSSGGQINPVKAVGKIARHYDIPFLLDACQSAGQIALDMDDIGCDMAAFTTRKFLRGPRGLGALFIRADMLAKINPVFMTNMSAVWSAKNAYIARTDARIFEAWERNVAACLGFGAAVNYLLEHDQTALYARTQQLAKRLRRGLSAIKGINLTDVGDNLSAIVTCEVHGRSALEVKEFLAKNNITGQVASVVHTRLDLEPRGLGEIVRLSPHYYNLESEIDKTLEIMAQAVRQ